MQNPRGLFIDDAQLTKNFVLAGGQDPTGTAVVLVWNARTGSPLRRLTLTQAGIEGEQLKTKTPSVVAEVTELPKRHLIAAYSALQELVILWSTKSWQRVQTIDVGPIGSFAVDASESTLLIDSLSDKLSELQSGNRHTMLRFIDLSSGQTKHTVISEGATFAGYSEQGTILEAVKGGLIRQLSEDGSRTAGPKIDSEGGEITAWALKPHSEVVAVASREGHVRLLNLHDGTASGPLPASQFTQPIDLSFNPNGNLLAASEGREDHLEPPEIWDLGTRFLVARACELAGSPPSKREWRQWTRSTGVDSACR